MGIGVGCDVGAGVGDVDGIARVGFVVGENVGIPVGHVLKSQPRLHIARECTEGPLASPPKHNPSNSHQPQPLTR